MDHIPYSQRLSSLIESGIQRIQKRITKPPGIQRYRYYGKSLFLPMAIFSVFCLALLLLLVMKLLLMPFIYYEGKSNGAD